MINIHFLFLKSGIPNSTSFTQTNWQAMLFCLLLQPDTTYCGWQRFPFSSILVTIYLVLVILFIFQPDCRLYANLEWITATSYQQFRNFPQSSCHNTWHQRATMTPLAPNFLFQFLNFSLTSLFCWFPFWSCVICFGVQYGPGSCKLQVFPMYACCCRKLFQFNKTSSSCTCYEN